MIGADVVEIMPSKDGPAQITAWNATRIAVELICLVADSLLMRRQRGLAPPPSGHIPHPTVRARCLMAATCQVCGEELSSQEELERHDHEIPIPWRDAGATFECPTCGVGFDQQEDLVAHMATH